MLWQVERKRMLENSLKMFKQSSSEILKKTIIYGGQNQSYPA